MTKTKLNAARIVVAVLLAVSLVAAVCLTAAAEEPAAAQTREFNDTFDRMLDDVTGADVSPAYRSVDWEAGKCDDLEDPILKLASKVIAGGFHVLNITLRSPDESVKLADLTLGLRISDQEPVKSFALDDADISGGITAEYEITNEWTTLSIDFSDTETGVTTEQPDSMVGFHLYATSAEKAGKLDIAKISVTKSETETVILDFAGVNDTYWFGTDAGTFVDMPACYDVADEKEIKSEAATSNNVDEKYDAVVLGIAGSGDVSLAPVGEDGTVGTAVAWADLTDLNGTALTALDGTFRNAVISLESLGAKKIQGVKVFVSGEGAYAKVSCAFFTNMDSRAADKNFPLLDADSIAYMSQFDFEYLTAGSDYEKAVADCVNFNMDYILSYSTKNNVITDGHLVLDAKGEAFTSIKFRSKVASEGRRYLVFKYKLENGATLNDFRFDVIKTDGDSTVGIKYANQCVAGFMLPSLSDANPYQATNGYKYLVVDLAETFGETNISGLDIYISGAGQVLIDEIFYAHPQVAEATLSDNVLTEPKVLTAPAKDPEGEEVQYHYLGGMDLDGKRHDGIEIVMKGSEGATLEGVCFALGGSELYFTNNDNLFYDVYGREMPALSEDNQAYVIDFAKSGITGVLENMHMHSNKAEDEFTITIDSIRYIDYAEPDVIYSAEALAEDFAKEITATEEGDLSHKYVGYVDGTKFAGNRFMQIDVEGDISSLRFEMAGGTYWFVENEGTFKNSDGELFDVEEKGSRTLVIDLVKSGVNVEAIEAIHIHNTFKELGDVLKITSVKFGSYDETLDYDSVVIPVNDDTKPVLDVSQMPATGKAGTEIELKASATDNYSAASEITLTYEVTLGSDKVTVTGNKFTPEKEGSYSVKVTATDKGGNSVSATATITVSAADPTDPGTSEKPKPLSAGAIAAIVIACVAVAGGAAAAVVIVLKKKKSAK